MIDLIVAVLGIISAVIGLLTAIMQLQHVSHPRGPQEARSINIRKWLKRVFMLFGIPFIVLIAYREWDSVKEMGLSIKGFADKATGVHFVVDSLKERSWPNLLPSGRYRVSISGGEYRYKCPGDKGSASGYPEGAPVTNSKSGKILVWTSSVPDDLQGNREEIVVAPNDTVFAKFDTNYCPELQQVVQISDVTIQFSRMR